MFRVGQNLPAPGVDVRAVKACTDRAARDHHFDLYGLADLFSGGGLPRLTVFALGVLPVITAGLLVSLLAAVSPRMRERVKAGPVSLRALTAGVAVLEAAGLVALAASRHLVPGCRRDLLHGTGVLTVTAFVVCVAAGAVLTLWLAGLITRYGIGDGVTVLMYASIIAVLPRQLWHAYGSQGGPVFALVLALTVAAGVGVVCLAQAQRRIPIQYSKRMMGRRPFGGTATYVPVRVTQAGITPITYASVLMFPPVLRDGGVWQLALFCVVFVFLHFFVAATFDVQEVSDKLKRAGGFVPGIRPGRPTAEYLGYVLQRLTAGGVFFQGMLLLVPVVVALVSGAADGFPLGLVIALLMFVRLCDLLPGLFRAEAMRAYAGFLK
ncbi:preprotein translocase subunit SecY [Actinomadura macrotermitis]|uniref:Protein translocase subunit SecY n=1 Tax=Actinomadura macrotermitis TaxID=2585200 RepID=A0A7K0C017_9ACTN|nr:preprotein translocase subunit SecY [Actinomadura macrotermitis]MQY06432.1 Protein translocase subunit SecY [Actinomadura macrotermitis]